MNSYWASTVLSPGGVRLAKGRDRGPGVARGGGRRLAHPYLLTHHVQDGLLPLKQTVRHLLEPRTTFLVRRFTARVGDGLSARSFVTGPDTGLTDGNAAPTMDAVGRQSHDELAWTDRIPSPGGWTPPSGVKPGWAWLPPSGASPRLEAMPMWVRLWYWTPFIDRWAYVWMWDHGGLWVEPPGSAPPREDASVREPIRPTPPARNASVAKHLPGTS